MELTCQQTGVWSWCECGSKKIFDHSGIFIFPLSKQARSNTLTTRYCLVFGNNQRLILTAQWTQCFLVQTDTKQLQLSSPQNVFVVCVFWVIRNDIFLITTSAHATVVWFLKPRAFFWLAKIPITWCAPLDFLSASLARTDSWVQEQKNYFSAYCFVRRPSGSSAASDFSYIFSWFFTFRNTDIFYLDRSRNFIFCKILHPPDPPPHNIKLSVPLLKMMAFEYKRQIAYKMCEQTHRACNKKIRKFARPKVMKNQMEQTWGEQHNNQYIAAGSEISVYFLFSYTKRSCHGAKRNNWP